MSKKLVTDQLQRSFWVSQNPSRIISLVPSITALLNYFDLSDRVIGITKFCIEPTEWFTTKIKVGGTKNPKIAQIKAIQPDLIIANKEENNAEDVASLSEFAPVWVTNVNSIADAIQMILDIGSLTNRVEMAQVLVYEIKHAWQFIKPLNSQSVFYAIWQKPYLFAGNDTYINDILNKLGLKNLAASKNGRYPEIPIDVIVAENPTFLFLSSEPYPFAEKHAKALRALMPNTKVVLVDGMPFSWYGPHLLHAAKYFERLLLQLSI